ncbi:MAG: EAL domain-containing protein [Gammaproteobacteria bacterium]|nr:EAL domain-containing protein [Gammaproteobacteria bacterium]
MEKKILRALIIDDSPDDVEVTLTTLRKAGYTLKMQRVQDATGVQNALAKGEWDIVLCEFALPHFGAEVALELVKSAGLDVPFIVLTRAIKDTDLVRIMHAGARDVIPKAQPARLPPVVTRELGVAELTRQHRQIAQQLKEAEQKHRAVTEGSREAIGYCLDGMHIDANQAYLDVFGYENFGELEGIPVMNLIDKGDQARFKDYLRKATNRGPQPAQQFQAIRRDSSRFHVELTAAPITMHGEKCAQLLAEDISKRKTVEDKLQYLNQRDPLTGLYNRGTFLQELNKFVDLAKQGKTHGGLVYLDMAQLKEINTTFGHATGDRILVQAAKFFRDRFADTATPARFGGEEFMLLLPNGDEAALKQMAETIRDYLKGLSLTKDGKTYTCHCTYGLALIDRNTTSTQAAIATVFSLAKQAAEIKQPAPVAEPDKPGTAKTPLDPAVIETWATRLRTALEKNEFHLAYQPIINLHGEPAEMFEVLLRLTGPNNEAIEPGQFMPAAEAAGLMPAIDRWVVDQSLRALAELQRQGRATNLFINLTPSAFKDADLMTLLVNGLKELKVKPESVVLEADEDAIIAHYADAKTFIQAAKKLGCRFTVDNFGTNLATLNQIRDMPVQFLKISGAIVRNLSTDRVSQASLKAVIELAQALDKQTIAKSVEKAEDMSILFNLGVDYVQGHYFQEADTQMQQGGFGGGSPSRSAAP